MGIPEKILKVLRKLMGGWQTRLEIKENGKVKTSRWISILKGFLQGDSYASGILLDRDANCYDAERNRSLHDGTTRRKERKKNT